MCGLLAPAGPVPDQVQFHSALLGTDGISAILATLSTLPLAGAAHGESAGGGGAGRGHAGPVLGPGLGTAGVARGAGGTGHSETLVGPGRFP